MCKNVCASQKNSFKTFLACLREYLPQVFSRCHFHVMSQLSLQLRSQKTNNEWSASDYKML